MNFSPASLDWKQAKQILKSASYTVDIKELGGGNDGYKTNKKKSHILQKHVEVLL